MQVHILPKAPTFKGEIMPDTLTKLFDDYQKATPDAVSFQFFQAGYTAAAVSMRTRAMAACDGKKDVNEIKNAIGSLSDIPK